MAWHEGGGSRRTGNPEDLLRAARIKASSHELLPKLREMTSDDESSFEHETEEEPSSNEVIEDQGSGASEEISMVETVSSQGYGPESDTPVLNKPAVGASEGQSGKKPSRRTAAAK